MTHIVQLTPALAATAATSRLAGDDLFLAGPCDDHLAHDLLAVEDERPLPDRSALEAVLERWSAEHGALEVVALTRGLGPVAERLAARYAGAAPRHCVVLGRDRCWLTRPRLPWLRDRFNREAARALQGGGLASRAAVKWRQTAPLMAWLGLEPHAVGHWLELGAAPGGMTRELVRGGARVTAVDLAALPSALAAVSQVRFVQADALSLPPFDAAELDGMVCDLNGPPPLALQAAARHAQALRPGAPFAVTLKLGRLDALDTQLEQARARLATGGLEVLRHQKLSSHRPGELVLVGRCRA